MGPECGNYTRINEEQAQENTPPRLCTSRIPQSRLLGASYDSWNGLLSLNVLKFRDVGANWAKNHC